MLGLGWPGPALPVAGALVGPATGWGWLGLRWPGLAVSVAGALVGFNFLFF